MVFMSSIEKPESKESTSSTKKFKMNTQSHTNSLNIVLESEIESLDATELRSSLTSTLIEISAVLELTSKISKEEKKDLRSVSPLYKEIMRLKSNPKKTLSALFRTNSVF